MADVYRGIQLNKETLHTRLHALSSMVRCYAVRARARGIKLLYFRTNRAFDHIYGMTEAVPQQYSIYEIWYRMAEAPPPYQQLYPNPTVPPLHSPGLATPSAPPYTPRGHQQYGPTGESEAAASHGT